MPEQPGLDERTGAFVIAAFHLTNAIFQREELRTRDMVLRSANGVICNLLRTMQYPRDESLIPEIANITLELTRFLDNIVLNAELDDPRLQALQQIAKSESMWPILARNGDKKLTECKLARLHVGELAPLGAPPQDAKRPPSMATPSNRLAMRLIKQVNSGVQLCLKNSPNGVVMDCTAEHVHTVLRLMNLDIRESEHNRFLGILRRALKHPFSTGSLTEWAGILADFVLCVDPHLKYFQELRRIKSSKGPKYVKDERSKLRSNLQKFFLPALRSLANNPRYRSAS